VNSSLMMIGGATLSREAPLLPWTMATHKTKNANICHLQEDGRQKKRRRTRGENRVRRPQWARPAGPRTIRGSRTIDQLEAVRSRLPRLWLAGAHVVADGPARTRERFVVPRSREEPSVPWPDRPHQRIERRMALAYPGKPVFFQERQGGSIAG
jgi:hypothetical protein